MHPEGSIIIEIFGEGKTDVGTQQEDDPKPETPHHGVVPIIVHKLCNNPGIMKVRRHRTIFLQGKGLWQKVRFARLNKCNEASGGAVYVVDSEGDLKSKREELCKGRDAGPVSIPMAVGVAHPCIESWLLADPDAIKRGLNLNKLSEVPPHPEELPAPQKDRNCNPKTTLREIAGIVHRELSAEDKDCIAIAMNDMQLVRTRCPQGFAPFADEVESHIRPLFASS